MSFLTSRQIPAFAKVKTHACIEVNGFIFVWHHAEDIEPTWEPFAVPEVDPKYGDDAWVYRGRTEYEVTAHIQDLPENGADAQHLTAIHTESFFSGGDLTHWIANLFKWKTHEWAISWAAETQEERKHIGILELDHAVRIGKHSIMQMKVSDEMNQRSVRISTETKQVSLLKQRSLASK